MFKITIWHSIVGSSDLLDPKLKKNYDKWVLLGFFFLFALIQIVLAVWFFRAKKHKSKLEREEKIFLKNFNTPASSNVNLKSFNYRVRM